MPDTPERRSAPRIPVTVPVELHYDQGFSLHSTENLSLGGVYFDSIPYPAGSRLKVLLRLPGESKPLYAEGEVANVPHPGGFGMGVRFLSLTESDRARLAAFLDEQERAP